MRFLPSVVLAASSLAFAQSAAAGGLFGHRSLHASPAPAPAATTTPVVTGTSATVLRSINSERFGGHVAPVAFDGRVSGVAQAYANDMARRGFFAHVSPEGQDPFDRMHRAGIDFRVAGETIGRGRDAGTAERLVYGDAAHRAIILDGRFRHVGIGSARTLTDVILVEDFTD